MTGMRPIAGALVCWGVLALTASGQETSLDQPDVLRQDISELQALVVELVKRIDSLEKQVTRLKPDINMKTAVWPGRDPAEVKDEAEPVVIFNGLHRGMMFDAIEHRMRWRAATKGPR